MTTITNYVFFAQFFNTGFLILLVNANMKEHEPKFLTQYITKGSFYDYSPQWYTTTGKLIIQTMIISAMMPLTGVVTGISLPVLLRWMDSMDPFKTKKKC